MQRILLVLMVLFISFSAVAQPKIDLGIKGGVNFSKISFDTDDYSSESVTKSHFGGFGRIGWNRIFIQPEFYFSGKGGDVTSDIASTMGSFDYKTFDVPVLMGFRLIKGKAFDFHVIAGPVFSGITSEEVKGGDMLDDSFYKNHYMSIQYGVGIDVLFLTIDARMENGLGEFYVQNGNSARNNTLMLSVGFKIL